MMKIAAIVAALFLFACAPVYRYTPVPEATGDCTWFVAHEQDQDKVIYCCGSPGGLVCFAEVPEEQE
jgi:hypothetical protein